MKLSCVILAGGRGTRLAGVLTDRPKPMAITEGKPFIEWVIAYCSQFGVRDYVVSLGHMASVAQTYFDAREAGNTTVTTVVEREALGTGGAFLYAASTVESESYLLTNGDSLLLADLHPALKLLDEKSVDGVIVGRYMEDASRYGTLRMGSDNVLQGFEEKRAGSGIVNGGIYLFKHRLLKKFPAFTPMSIEQEGIPSLLRQGVKILVTVSDAPFLDIGLPETLQQAENFIRTYFPGEGRCCNESCFFGS